MKDFYLKIMINGLNGEIRFLDKNNEGIDPLIVFNGLSNGMYKVMKCPEQLSIEIYNVFYPGISHYIIVTTETYIKLTR